MCRGALPHDATFPPSSRYPARIIVALSGFRFCRSLRWAGGEGDEVRAVRSGDLVSRRSWVSPCRDGEIIDKRSSSAKSSSSEQFIGRWNVFGVLQQGKGFLRHRRAIPVKRVGMRVHLFGSQDRIRRRFIVNRVSDGGALPGRGSTTTPPETWLHPASDDAGDVPGRDESPPSAAVATFRSVSLEALIAGLNLMEAGFAPSSGSNSSSRSSPARPFSMFDAAQIAVAKRTPAIALVSVSPNRDLCPVLMFRHGVAGSLTMVSPCRSSSFHGFSAAISAALVRQRVCHCIRAASISVSLSPGGFSSRGRLFTVSRSVA